MRTGKTPINVFMGCIIIISIYQYKKHIGKSIRSNLTHWNFEWLSSPLYAHAALEVDPNKDIVCQLCGAWFETRKGLSSHARAHLRHFGVEYSESKGSPIDLLAQLVSTDDFKHKVSEMQADGHPQLQQLQQQQSSPSLLNLSKASRSSPSSLLYKVTTAASKATSAAASSPFGPPPKRHKSSSMRVFRLSSGELMALHSEFFFFFPLQQQLCHGSTGLTSMS